LSRVFRMLFFLFLASTLIGLVRADRGMIPVSVEASIYEPGQKAILAWNGQEEIMILSTDVSSSKETLVLEILPLPSQPTVEAAGFESFTEIQMLMLREGLSVGYWSSEDEAQSRGVEIVFHEEIGAHNISVVRSTDTQELVSWMNDFLEQSGVDEETTLLDFESAVQDYMKRGYRYYVLDLITVSQEKRSVDPILYRFNSSFLYYPLVFPLSRAQYFTEGSWKRIEFLLSVGDLAGIDIRIAEMFEDGAWLSVLKYDGEMKLLTKDLIVSDILPLYGLKGGNSALLPSLFAVGILLGSAATLAGVLLTLLITRERKPRNKETRC